MWLCGVAPISQSLSPSVSLLFLREKLDSGQSVFWSQHGKRRQKAEEKKKASIQSPIILYSWSPMCFYYLKHSPSTESSILSHCEAIIWGAISTDAKIVLFAKYWLSKMGPQGLNGREYWIPYPTSHWWIMVFLLALLSLICLISLHKLWIPTVRKCRL